MPKVRLRTGAALAALLLALAACGRAPNAPAPPAGNETSLTPVPSQSSAPPTVPAPAQGTDQLRTDPVQDEGDGPRDRFVVCPGNPRCPPGGSEPKGR